MKITTIGRQMEVQEDLKLLFERKLKKFDKFFDDDTTAYVTLSKIKNLERLELTISKSRNNVPCQKLLPKPLTMLSTKL